MGTEQRMGYGRAALIGGAIGFPAVAAVVAAIAWVGGFEFTSAVGIGVFAALWGGIGLGSMMGAIVVVTRRQDG